MCPRALTFLVAGDATVGKLLYLGGLHSLQSLIPCTLFSLRWYLCAWKSQYALHPVSQNVPQRCLSNGSNSHLTDDGPLSSFQGRSSSASSFLQAIDSVMSLALCPQLVSQAPQHFRSSRFQGFIELLAPGG